MIELYQHKYGLKAMLATLYELTNIKTGLIVNIQMFFLYITGQQNCAHKTIQACNPLILLTNSKTSTDILKNTYVY